MKNVATLFDWLVDGAPGAKTPMEVLAHLNPGLVAAGVAVARCEAFVRTLHPHIAGRSFLWRPGAAVDVIIVRAMRALMLIPVLLVVAATSCKPPAAEACGAFVKTFNAERSHPDGVALGQALLKQHAGPGVRECDDVRLLLEAQQRDSDALDATGLRLAENLGRRGAPVEPAVQQKLRGCFEGCRAPTVNLFGCMQACGCRRSGVEVVGDTKLQGVYACDAGAPTTCSEQCMTKEAELLRDDVAYRCAKQCTRELATALGDAEHLANVKLHEACCKSLDGVWKEDDSCTSPRPQWFSVCKNTRGARSQPTPQECCTECAGVVTGTGCNTSTESDRCFVKCLKTIP